MYPRVAPVSPIREGVVEKDDFSNLAHSQAKPQAKPRRLRRVDTPPGGDASERPPSPRVRTGSLSGRRILVAVTGSIAAYKSVLLVRLLLQQGAQVSVVLTEAALKFVGEATFSGLTQEPVHVQMFGGAKSGELHVRLASEADLLVIAPATAQSISQLATGQAGDLLSATALCITSPVLIAPAMHPRMWAHPATQRNIRTLSGDGFVFVGPATGEVASGDSGTGRMAEPGEIADAVVAALSVPSLAGRHIVVTAGPTVEDIDPVRYISNRSSGKMGFAIARRARLSGATVTLISGPVQVATPAGVKRVDVRSALELKRAMWAALGPKLAAADALVMSAAVSDYRVRAPKKQKLKRSERGASIELVANPDLLSEVGKARRGDRPLLIGFALETQTGERLTAAARRKLQNKRVDLIVANQAHLSLERDTTRASLVSKGECVNLVSMTKDELAEHIVKWLVRRFESKSAR